MRALRAALCVMVVLAATNAHAVTVEVARKCNALLAKKFPPRVPGNPAAGSAQGSGTAQRDFYKQCVASGGTIGDDDTKPNSK